MTDKPSLNLFFDVSGINTIFIHLLSLNFQRVNTNHPLLGRADTTVISKYVTNVVMSRVQVSMSHTANFYLPYKTAYVLVYRYTRADIKNERIIISYIIIWLIPRGQDDQKRLLSSARDCPLCS